MAKFKFKLLSGKHTDREGPPDERGMPQLRVFRKGQVIETVKDLDAIFNHPTIDRKKFERVDDATKASVPEYRISLSTPPAEPAYAGQVQASAVRVPARAATPQSPVVPVTSPPTTPPQAQAPAQAKPAATPQQAKATDTLDAMSDKELDAFAASEEIDLKGAKGRADKIKAIRAAVG
jgi:cell division septation protein DedD